MSSEDTEQTLDIVRHCASRLVGVTAVMQDVWTDRQRRTALNCWTDHYGNRVYDADAVDALLLRIAEAL